MSQEVENTSEVVGGPVKETFRRSSWSTTRPCRKALTGSACATR